MSVSQRTADEREHRRGLVLGLTLAEVLLLLLFLLILALAWRMENLQRQADEHRRHAEALSTELIQLRATLGSLSPLLKELQAKGQLDIRDVQELAARMARADGLALEVENLKQANSELTAVLGNMKIVGADVAKLRKIEAALAAATKIDPNDPPEFLARAVEVLKRLGPETRPEQVRALTELITESEKLKMLQGALTEATSINSTDPVEAIERALAILKRVGPDTRPEQIVRRDQYELLAKNLDKTQRELEKFRGPGNGLTMPSCWKTKPPQEQIEYIFDITIRDDGVIVRDATPSRSTDPDWKLVGPIARNEVISETVLTRETTKLLQHSKRQNCRYYAIVRDATGEGKQRYKTLLKLVEGRFYKLELSEPWSGAVATPAGARVPTVGGPYEAPSPTPLPLRQ